MASHVVLVAAVAAAVLASLVPGVPAPSVVRKGKKRALVLLERPAWKLLGLTGMTGGALWKFVFLYKTALCAHFTLADRELDSPMPSSITRAGGTPNYYQTLNERMGAAAADNLPVGIVSGKFFLRRTKSFF